MESIPDHIFVDVKLGEPPADQDLGFLVPVAIIDGGQEYPLKIISVRELRGGTVRCLVQAGEYEYYIYGRGGRWWMVA